MPNDENPFAGQGPVLLDIGGEVGALVVAMPAGADGLEVEIRPAGTTVAGHGTSGTGHAAPSHHHSDHHPSDHDHPHPHAPGHHHPHVGVVARPGVDGPAHTLVYPEVTEGDYELVPIPGDTVVMTARVEGGVVTHTAWPQGGPLA